MGLTGKMWVACAVVCAVVAVQAREAGAGFVYSGKDTASAIAKHMGLDPSRVLELARVAKKGTKRNLESDGLKVVIGARSGGKPIDGTWDFNGSGEGKIVLAVNTSNGNGNPNSGHGWEMVNFGKQRSGNWTVESIWSALSGNKKKFMHHVTAYRVMPDPVKVVTNPIPGAVWLFGTALAALALVARRRIIT